MRKRKHSDEEMFAAGNIGANVRYTYEGPTNSKYPSDMGSANLWFLETDPNGRFHFWRVLLGNFVSSILAGFLFLFIATWSQINQAKFGGDVITVALAQGVGVWFIMHALGAISADFNPIITFAEMLMPHWRQELVKNEEPSERTGFYSVAGKSWIKAIILGFTAIVGSFGGSLLGALLGGVLDVADAYEYGTPVINVGAGITQGVALLVEAMGTAIWFWAILVAFQDRYRTRIVNPEAFLAFVWTALVMLSYNFTGASFNFWRHLAPALLSGIFDTPASAGAWVYYVGPAIGALIALVWFFVQRNSSTSSSD